MKIILIIILCFQTLFSDDEITSTHHFPVGELNSKWQFPSDHLPIGAKVGNIHFASWNILDTKYLFHIYENGQGLKGSLITELDTPVEDSDLTQRDALVIQNILSLLQNNPRHLLALEEVGEPVYHDLKKKLPPHFKIAPENPNEDIFIYDEKVFDYVEYGTTPYQISKKSISRLTLREKNTGLLYHFYQSHVPGGPVNSPPARKEFAKAVLEQYDPQATTVLMGDMNRSPDYFLTDFEKIAFDMGIEQTFTNLMIPYPTHVDPTLSATWIDNLFISNPYDLPITIDSKETEFFPSVLLTIELLEGLHR